MVVVLESSSQAALALLSASDKTRERGHEMADYDNNDAGSFHLEHGDHV